MRSDQHGFALVEAAVAAAIVAVAAAGALYAIGAYGHFVSHQAGPVRVAATAVAEQTLRTAQDAWKYGSPGDAPAGSQTVRAAIAIPGAAPTSVPLTVTTSIANASPTQAQVTVSVSYPPDPDRPGDTGNVSLSGAASVKAPPPGSQIADPQAIPAPTGAP